MDGKIKAPPPVGRMGLVGLEIFGIQATRPAGAFHQIANDFNAAWLGVSALSHEYAGR
jgi:hypothetical protein